MAVTLFSKTAGHVISFPDPTLPARSSVTLEGWGGYTNFKSIITNMTLASQGNFQFLHTLGGNIYVYVFGDRIGQMSVSGLSFENTCGDTGSIGIERVLAYYNTNRIAGRKTPMKITVGAATTFTVYLIGVGAAVQDTQSRLWQYNLQMALVPFNKRKRSASSGTTGTTTTTGTGGTTSGGGTTTGGGQTGVETFPPVQSGSTDPGGAVLGVTDTAEITADGYSAVGTGPGTDLV